MDIADRILLLRGDKTREQFTEGLKTSAQTLYKYETRAGKPSVEFVDQICRKFKVSYAWLITGEGPMRSSEAQQPAENALEPPASTPEAVSCARCAKLEAKLDKVEQQRDELAIENRQLLRENGDLKAKCATLEERQKHCCPESQVFEKLPNIPPSKADLRA